MANQIVVFVCCVFALHHVAAEPPYPLHLDINPANISAGLTSQLIINCSYTHNDLSDISSALSLIISKVETQNATHSFQELVSLTVFASSNVTTFSRVDSSISGKVEANDDSYLSLTWTYPTSSVSGGYRCNAHVLTNTGHPAELSKEGHVTVRDPDLYILIKEVSVLQSMFKIQENKQAKMIEVMFEKSEEYNGGHFLLSKQPWQNVDVAEVICEHFGGYLAEIDDFFENDFITKFVDTFAAAGVSHVLVGATDEETEGTWIYRCSRRPVTYTDWSNGEPNTAVHDCMVLYQPYGWEMLDYPCYNIGTSSRHFLCEIPSLN